MAEEHQELLYALAEGERYLIFASPVAGKPGVVRGTGAQLNGKVTVKTVKYGESDEGAAGVRVVAVAGETWLETATDAGGAFALSGVPTGVYHLDGKADNYVADGWRSPQGDVRMGTNGCGYQTLGVWPNGQVSGVVRGVNGTVLKGVKVQTFAKDRRGSFWSG